MPYALALVAALLLTSTAAYADRDHRDRGHERHVWHRGERGYNPGYGAPYYGAPYYGTPGVGVQLR